MSHWTYLWISILVTCGGLALMGLPGMLLIVTTQALFRFLRRPLPALGERLLPMTLGLTLYWGPLLYPSYWLTRWFAWAEWWTWPLWLLAGLLVTFDLWPRTP